MKRAPRYTLRYSGLFDRICEVFDNAYQQVVATYYHQAAHETASRMVKRLNRD